MNREERELIARLARVSHKAADYSFELGKASGLSTGFARGYLEGTAGLNRIAASGFWLGVWGFVFGFGVGAMIMAWRFAL